MTAAFSLTPGDAPILISMPHVGTALPADIALRLTPHARQLPDTDWFVDRLYDFAASMGIGVIKAVWSRYVIDLNRPADGGKLYPDQAETGLVPLVDFDGEPLYAQEAPDEAEIRSRMQQYWTPYHRALDAELNRLRARHGYVLLWEAHSIRRQIPRLFDGPLPDLNIGTAGGHSCAAAITTAVIDRIRQNGRFTHVVNGRFKGGHLTRHFGAPATGIHALQMEIAQSVYMQEQPPLYDPIKAEPLRALLGGVMAALLRLPPERLMSPP